MKIILTILFLYFFVGWYVLGLEATSYGYLTGLALTTAYVLANIIFQELNK